MMRDENLKLGTSSVKGDFDWILVFLFLVQNLHHQESIISPGGLGPVAVCLLLAIHDYRSP